MLSQIDFIVIEDEENICEKYKAEVKRFDSLFLIDTTNSTQTALELVKEYKPNAIVLDLELHKGFGNGITFLKDLLSIGLEKKPFILVVTNNISSVTHNIVRNLGADFVITKNQSDYSIEMVLGFLQSLNDITQISDKATNINSESSRLAAETEYTQKLQSRILTELDIIGISPKMKGRQYLTDAIELTCNEKRPNLCSIIGKKYSKTDASVERAMQTAINHAWRNTDIDTLEKNYTAYINPHKGVPTVTEFIYYYAEKVKRNI